MRSRTGRSRAHVASIAVVTAVLAASCSGGVGQAWRSSGPRSASGLAEAGISVSVTPVRALGPTGGGATIVATASRRSNAASSLQVFVDNDNDRSTGMWTFQSPLSASGWDLLIDGAGKLYRHDGPPNVWRWQAVSAPGFRRVTAGNRLELFIPPSLLRGSPLQVRAAVEAGDDWYPAAFLPGVGSLPDSVPDRRPQSGQPGPLAIFYGPSPWLVRGCRPTDPMSCPARAFGEFAHVVLGAGLEEVAHTSHTRAEALVTELRVLAPETEVWGYVSLVGGPATRGVRTVVYTLHDIRARAAAWKAMGATGIFLDEVDLCHPARDRCAKDASGKELEVSRARQAAAAAAIHDLDMPVFANGFAVPDVLGAVDGAPSPLLGARGGRRADVYLLENLSFSAGRRVSGFDARVGHARLELALRLVGGTGVRLAAVDTVEEAAPDLASSSAFYREGLALASKAGLDAYGFTNSSYSSRQGVATNLPLPPADAALDSSFPCSSRRTAC